MFYFFSSVLSLFYIILYKPVLFSEHPCLSFHLLFTFYWQTSLITGETATEILLSKSMFYPFVFISYNTLKKYVVGGHDF